MLVSSRAYTFLYLPRLICTGPAMIHATAHVRDISDAAVGFGPSMVVGLNTLVEQQVGRPASVGAAGSQGLLH